MNYFKLPKGNYYYGKPLEWIGLQITKYIRTKGYRLIYVGYILKPYTFWKVLFSFKQIPFKFIKINK